MSESDHFFKALGVKSDDRKAVARFSKATGISAKALRYYNNTSTLPTGEDLDRLCSAAGISPLFFRLRWGKSTGKFWRPSRKTPAPSRISSKKVRPVLTIMT